MNDITTNTVALPERALHPPMKSITNPRSDSPLVDGPCHPYSWWPAPRIVGPMSCKWFSNELPMANSSSRNRHSGRSSARPQHATRTTATNELTYPSRPLLRRRLKSKGNTI